MSKTKVASDVEDEGEGGEGVVTKNPIGVCIEIFILKMIQNTKKVVCTLDFSYQFKNVQKKTW